ncbi:MAG: metallophosphoesterase [Chloroflexota bacterium]
MSSLAYAIFTRIGLGGLAAIGLLALTATGFLAWRVVGARLPHRNREAQLAALTILFFGFLDWALLSALPHLGLSFGPVAPALLAFSMGRAAVFLVALLTLLALNLAQSRSTVSPAARRLSPALAALWALNLVLSACAVYGLYIEPFDLHTSHVNLPAPAFLPDRPLRIVHISDIHVERITRRERDLIETVRSLHPDLILLTGDYLNIDYTTDDLTRQDGRAVLAQFSAPYGVYAVAGTRGVDTPQAMRVIFDGVEATLLQDETRLLEFPGGMIYLVGVSTLNRPRDSAMLAQQMVDVPRDAYSVLLYHTPDLADAAAQAGVDLYLGGHTHGGQVRLPFWGALVTMSAYGKKYESGLYTLGPMHMYISRGVGMEGLRLPRLRFLCPPEVTLIELGPEGSP